MEAKHNPGPWHWSDAYPNAQGEPTWSLVAGGGFGVLSCDWANSPQASNPANAHLIAAAPDMLEALEQFTGDACDHDPAPVVCRYCMARAALQKARKP